MIPGDPGGGPGLPYNGVFNSSRHRERGVNGAEVDSLFLDSDYSKNNNGASYNNHRGPSSGLSSDFLAGDRVLSSSLPRSNDVNSSSSRYDAFDRASIGENMVRSQSAAPSFDGRLPLGPPPGLANRATPVVSNLSASSPGGRGGVDSYLIDSALDRSRILQIGQRRPASTGVIGQNNSSAAVLNSLGLGGGGNGAVRPAAKTLMDLIQEDFPDPYDTRDNFLRESNVFEMERPRTTSPLSYQREQYLYGNNNHRNIGVDNFARDGRTGLSHALDRLDVKSNDPYAPPVSLDC
jgi:hypothetical protein